MIQHAIEHRPVPQYIYPVSRQTLMIRIRVAREDCLECNLIYWPRDNVEEKKIILMQCKQRDALFDYYEATVNFSNVARYTKYFFELTDTKEVKIYVTSHGLMFEKPVDGYFEYLYSNENDIVEIPEWSKGQIYYQIFPERFKNGDTINDHHGCVPWGTPPTRENYMGGDIKGIIQKHDYLKELGIDCIYLNPIFKASSNHKYDTIDYFHVDPDFGTNEDLKKLVRECHKNNIKIILDGVFNHTGVAFPAFKDILEKQEKSKYKDWFYITKYPIEISHHNYECVGAYKWMPKLRTANPEVRKFILEVMEFWIREADIDGWRLDVADEVDYVVWQMARSELKYKYPNLLLIGEAWGNASKMLQGDQLDIVMNYVFRDAVKDYFTKQIKPSELDARLNRMLSEYHGDVNLSMYNLLDSHDTRRFLTECNGDSRIFKLAVAFQFLFCGSPAIYYGDEIGMTGENDPDCRRAMIWEKEKLDEDILNWYKRLINIRKNSSAIKLGSYYTVYCDDCNNVFGFLRNKEDEDVYVIMNAGNTNVSINLPIIKGRNFEDLLLGNKIESIPITKGESFYNQDLLEYSRKLQFPLSEYSVKILKLRMEE